MLTPIHLRDLQLQPGDHPRRQAHLSAASGLAILGPWLYVISDDEHHLAIFAADAGESTAAQLHRILAGDLPMDVARRKKRKPDLEALVVLPPTAEYPLSALLALGSGSRPNREQALVIALDPLGRPAGSTRSIDLAALYEPLRVDFPDLNIEGAFMAGEFLHLLQRGNKGDARNACITYPRARMQDWMAARTDAPPAAARISEFSLGDVDGVPLGFTDGAALLGGGWVFSAVAEDTDDSYRDGACRGSAIGWVNADRLHRLETIVGAPKVEGIAINGAGRLLMVTDSDDPVIASQLWAVDLGES